MKEKEKVAIAMSGGVDSGAAAALLVEEGYNVVGLHLNFWKESQEGAENRCCSLESMEAARKTAHQLGIPFYVKDYSKDFKKIVVDYFLTEYAAGRTPNPCVVCNQFIKFGKLLDYARALGCDFLATGHYARIVQNNSENGSEQLRKLRASERQRIRASERQRRRCFGVPDFLTFRFSDRLAHWLTEFSEFSEPPSYSEFSGNPRYHLLKGIDNAKDQSYFLWTLTQDKLAHILFPIGDRRKSKVKKIARVKNLPVSGRPESFEVCFILDDDYRDFLKRHIPETINPGEVVNTKGEVIGKHFGLPLYTIGQRKGFKVQSSVPLYVIGSNLEKNQLVVGRGGESERQKFAVGNVNWVSGQIPGDEVKCQVRIRYQGPLLSSKFKVQSSKLVDVELEEPTRGVTPGQSAVFYRGEEVLGGGVIENFK